MSELNTGNLPDSLLRLCQHIANAGGKAWLVGGCVRDLMLGIEAKDFDIEVYGLESEKLQSLLSKSGRCEYVGQQFGVLKLWMHGLEIDVALPRSETKSARGHQGFQVSTNPHMSPKTASLRRDFSINAMMFEPLQHQLLDFHNGQKDLENKLLRHVSAAFSEDPLRPLRAMQFAARFQLRLDQQTAALCHSLVAEADSLPTERIWNEWQKWSHAAHPSYGLQALKDSGWLNLYPALQAMIGCAQNPRWHPEGDVWVHTLLVCDQAAAVAKRHQLGRTTREQLLFAALCHDFGKPAVSSIDAAGNIRSPGHSTCGVPIAKAFMRSIGSPGQHIQYIAPLVAEHITHLHSLPTARAVRRLAHRLEPANIELWEMLVEADASGRAPAPPSRPALPWLKMATQQDHHQHKPAAMLTGKLLLKLDYQSGPAMGAILKAAYEAQLDGQIHDYASLLSWLNKNHKITE